jgi:UDP-N-acetylglucosamine 2-epimerase (non-hydrolysing)/GDP/UDP-N,N'-diacetylbacillosamine 2-epimerase (hydrolysing)
MRRVLEAIRSHPRLQLQLVVTGMHLHTEHGKSIDEIQRQGWKIDAVVPWKAASSDATELASQTGLAMSRLAQVYDKLRSDIVLVTGDRVEVFAAASAAHLGQRIVAHVHGGDRAAGQVDDALRHAVSKLAHIHFPATAQSAKRLRKLGEDSWRIHQAGSPGIDGITQDAISSRGLYKEFPLLRRHRFALLVLHPVDASVRTESARAEMILSSLQASGIEHIIAIYPNNDPGAQGIIRCWEKNHRSITYLLKDTPRSTFLALLRDSAMLVGNSSSGIIEAASFGTPVVDIGPRQAGRERSHNVRNVPYSEASIRAAIRKIWNSGAPIRWRGRNVYGGNDAVRRICSVLASVDLNDPRLRRKLIAY